MRRKASEPACGTAFVIVYDEFLCRKQSHVNAYISAFMVYTDMANTYDETN